MIDTTIQVLVADDSLTIATALALSLRRVGFAVTTTHSGEEALRIACDSSFDLIISDQQMLQMSGAELCRQLREHPRYHDTPFVLLTASSELDEDQLVKEVGLTCVCAKPFSPAAIAKLAKTLIGSASPA